MDHLGLDLGTTTISAAVLDADGRLLCTRTVPGGAAIAGQPWERKQDARGIEHAALSLLDGLLQEFPDIGCVGLTGQMHGIVYVDAAGQLLSPLYTWQDETGPLPSARSRTISPCGCPAERPRASRPPWPPASVCSTERTLTARPSAGRDCRNSSCRKSRRRQNWAADGCTSLPRSATIRPASSARGRDGSTRRS